MAFRDIIGQERALKIIQGMLRRGRLPSALLFSGDDGIGKKLTAGNLAKTVNCAGQPDFDCCDACPSCRKINAETHPDVKVVLPEKDELRVDAIRAIEESLSFKSFEGGQKVIIMDDADFMNVYAANAFLKTLEEPPADSLIILVSSNPDGLPDTIRSRCTNIRFNPLPAEKCSHMLAGRINPANEALVLNLAMGRPGPALSRDFAGDRDWFMKLLHSMLRGETKETWADRTEMKAWLDMADILLRDIAVFRITKKGSDLVLGEAGGCCVMEGKGPDPVLKSVMDAYEGLSSVKAFVDFNLNKSITWNYVSGIIRSIS